MVFLLFSLFFKDYVTWDNELYRTVNPSFLCKEKRPVICLGFCSDLYLEGKYTVPLKNYAVRLRECMYDSSFFTGIELSVKVSKIFYTGFSIGTGDENTSFFNKGVSIGIGVGVDFEKFKNPLRTGLYGEFSKDIKQVVLSGIYRLRLKNRIFKYLYMGLDMGIKNSSFNVKGILKIPVFSYGSLSAGVKFETDTSNGFTGFIGISLFSNRVERTDLFADYTLKLVPITHGVITGIKIGDALKEEKEKKRKEQMVRAIQIREEALRKEMERLKKIKKELEDLRNEIEKEKLSLEEKRREALEALKKLEGIRIAEEKEWLRIIAEERAIHFASGSAEIPFPDGYKVLVKIGRFLKTYPGKKIIIEGHTDNVPIGRKLRSKYPNNQALSEARAETIKKYFVEVEGIPAELITAVGYGDTRPIAPNDTEEGRAKNRRVEIKILK